MNERLREALRRKIALHNRLVRVSTIVGGLAVAAMWLGIYFIARWLTVFASTIVRGLDAAMPTHFDRLFALSTAAWLVAGFVAKRLGLFDRSRLESTPGLTILEVILAPPRATFAVLANIRSHVRFSEDDLIAATDFLVRVVRSGKMPATAVPVELPDETTRDRIITGLTLLDLIYLRQKKEVAWFAVSNPERLLAFLT